MKSKRLDHIAVPVSINAEERSMRVEFAFAGKAAVGENGLYLPGEKFRANVGDVVSIRQQHNSSVQAAGAGKVGIANGVAYADVKVYKTQAGDDLMEEYNVRVDEMGGTMYASVSVYPDWESVRYSDNLSAEAKRAGATWEYEVKAIPEISVVDYPNFVNARFSLNDALSELGIELETQPEPDPEPEQHQGDPEGEPDLNSQTSDLQRQIANQRIVTARLAVRR